MNAVCVFANAVCLFFNQARNDAILPSAARPFPLGKHSRYICDIFVEFDIQVIFQWLLFIILRVAQLRKMFQL